MNATDIKQLQEWIGNSRASCDVISADRVAALSASLDHAQPLALSGEPLPACWHWLYFHEAINASSLAVDGHARRGDFIPPIPLSRRMWAGSRVRFIAQPTVGEEARKVSTIADIRHKNGRTGELVFVTVRHQLLQGASLLIDEEQDLVYRNHEKGEGLSAPEPAPAQALWSREVTPDTVLLFRYSALTFNSHRIHYDRDYAVREEGYPSLVVQGPLAATLLLDLLHRELPGAVLTAFAFRAKRPLFEGAPLQLQGRVDGPIVTLWVLDAAGWLAMTANATLRCDSGILLV